MMAQRGERAARCKQGHLLTPENTHLQERGRGAYQRCRTCNRDRARRAREYHMVYQLKRRYGITPAERSAMLVAQDGLCAICYERPAVVVDHDHDTGKVRGMLCKACNTALGVLGENLAYALEYLTSEEGVA